MSTVLATLRDRLGRQDIVANEPLKRYTTFKIGGPADYFVEVSTAFDLLNTIATCLEIGLPYVILGGGSNVLIMDKGFRGLVIRNRGGEIKMVGDDEIEVTSGTLNNAVIDFAQEHFLSGIEFLVGIPGSIGATIRNNGRFRDPESFQEYGLNYRQVKDRFINDYVKHLLIVNPAGQIRRVGRDYLQPEYHRSKLKTTGDIVVSARLRLTPTDKETIARSIAVQRQWRRDRTTVDPDNRTAAAMPTDSVTGHTMSRQPALPSAGCAFSNIPNPENHPTGRMLDLCGMKGKRIGDVMVAPEHANWIVNVGDGKADDVLALIDLCKDAVYRRFGVELLPEIDMIGER